MSYHYYYMNGKGRKDEPTTLFRLR